MQERRPRTSAGTNTCLALALPASLSIWLGVGRPPCPSLMGQMLPVLHTPAPPTHPCTLQPALWPRGQTCVDSINGQPCPLPLLAFSQWGVPAADGREEKRPGWSSDWSPCRAPQAACAPKVPAPSGDALPPYTVSLCPLALPCRFGPRAANSPQPLGPGHYTSPCLPSARPTTLEAVLPSSLLK